MPFDQKRKIRWIQIFLIIFYGIALSRTTAILGLGIAETLASSESPYATTKIVLGALGVSWTGLVIYATV